MYNTIQYETNNGVAFITLNRPEVINAFNVEMHDELYSAVNEADADTTVRCIVLRGNGRGFSAGADLGSIDKENMDQFDHGAYLEKTYNRLLRYLTKIEKPVLASLHGAVFGAGLGVALGCDLRIAAAGSKLSVAFVKIGLMPDAGTTYFLPRLVGLGRAMQLSMLGEPVSAEEALRIGLVNRVVPDDQLAAETESLAYRLAQSPTIALGWIKKSLYNSFDHDLAGALAEEAEGQSVCGKTADHLEGVSAFFAKRAPKFSGR